VSEPRLFDAIARASEQRIDDFTGQNLTNTAWAFAVVGVATRGTLVKVVNARVAAIGITPLSLQGRTQLHQFFLSAELELRPPAELLAPIGLRDACKQAMADEPTASSKLHLEVSAELTRMGIAHNNELCLPKLSYHVDIAILPNHQHSRGGGASIRQGGCSREGGGARCDGHIRRARDRGRRSVAL